MVTGRGGGGCGTQVVGARCGRHGNPHVQQRGFTRGDSEKALDKREQLKHTIWQKINRKKDKSITQSMVSVAFIRCTLGLT